MDPTGILPHLNSHSLVLLYLNQLSMAGSHPTKWPFAAASFSASVLVGPVPMLTQQIFPPSGYGLDLLWDWCYNENNTFSGSFGTPFEPYPRPFQCVT